MNLRKISFLQLNCIQRFREFSTAVSVSDVFVAVSHGNIDKRLLCGKFHRKEEEEEEGKKALGCNRLH